MACPVAYEVRKVQIITEASDEVEELIHSEVYYTPSLDIGTP